MRPSISLSTSSLSSVNQFDFLSAADPPPENNVFHWLGGGDSMPAHFDRFIALSQELNLLAMKYPSINRAAMPFNKSLYVVKDSPNHVGIQALCDLPNDLSIQKIIMKGLNREAFQGLVFLMQLKLIALKGGTPEHGQIDWASRLVTSHPNMEVDNTHLPCCISMSERFTALQTAGCNLGIALGFAISTNSLFFVNALTALGVSLEVRDAKRNNALHVLCRQAVKLSDQGFSEALTWFLEKNIFLFTDRNNEGATPFDVLNESYAQFKSEFLSHLIKGANEGVPLSLCLLGSLYQSGSFVGMDTQVACSYFNAVMLSNTAPAVRTQAQYLLGAAKLSGQGVEQDIQHAKLLLLSSANSGVSRAMTVLALNGLYNMQATREDFLAAYSYLKAAADTQDPEAAYQFAIAPSFAHENLQISQTRFDFFITVAAKQGHPNALFQLGVFHLEQAIQFPQEKPFALHEENIHSGLGIQTLLLAKENGSVQAQEVLDKLQGNIQVKPRDYLFRAI